MEFTAEQIASVIGGRIEGNKEAKINTFAKIEEVLRVLFLSSLILNTHIISTTRSRL